MKITKREYWLCIILLAILVIYLFYSYYMLPQVREIQEIENLIIQDETFINDANKKLHTYYEDVERVNHINSQINKIIQNYYFDEEQEIYLKEIEKIFLLNEFKLLSVKSKFIEEYRPDLSTYKIEDPYSILGEENDRVDMGNIESIEITVEAIGEYKNVINLIESINEADKNIICREAGVNIGKSEPEGSNEVTTIKLNLEFIRFARFDNSIKYNNSDNIIYNIPKDLIDGSYKKKIFIDVIKNFLKN